MRNNRGYIVPTVYKYMHRGEQEDEWAACQWLAGPARTVWQHQASRPWDQGMARWPVFKGLFGGGEVVCKVSWFYCWLLSRMANCGSFAPGDEFLFWRGQTWVGAHLTNSWDSSFSCWMWRGPWNEDRLMHTSWAWLVFWVRRVRLLRNVKISWPL